jgi:osmotically-inducible protein OsmY
MNQSDKENKRQEVYKALNQNSYLNPQKIEVSIGDEEIILEGQVASLEEKWLVEDLTHDVYQDMPVINDIEVRES